MATLGHRSYGNFYISPQKDIPAEDVLEQFVKFVVCTLHTFPPVTLMALSNVCK